MPARVTEPLLPRTTKFLPSERSVAELPTTAVRVAREPLLVPFVNTFVPAASCEPVRM